MKLTANKIKDLILEVLYEMTQEESAEIQAEKVLNFLNNSLKFSPKTKSRYISDKIIFRHNGETYNFSEFENQLPEDKKRKFYSDVNKNMRAMIDSLEGTTSVEKIASLSKIVNSGIREQTEEEIARLILQGFTHVASEKEKQKRRDIKKEFMEQNKLVNKYFTGIHNVGFGYINGGVRGLEGITKFLKSKQSRQNDEESVWVFANQAGQKIPVHQGLNVEIEGPFTMIYPSHDAMTDRWDGQHSQGGGDKSKQAMGGRRFVKHSYFDFYDDEEKTRIDPELGIWSAIADIYREQRQGGLTGDADLLEGTMIGGVKSVIVDEKFRRLYFFMISNSLGNLYNASSKEKQIDYISLNEKGKELFEFGRVMEENKIVFKDDKLNRINIPIVSSAESLVKLIFGEEKKSLSPKEFEKLRRVSKKIKKLSYQSN